MSQYVDGKFESFLGAAAIASHLRVYLSAAGTVTLAGADNVGIGTIEAPSLAASGPCTVRLWNAEGTRKMVASEAITVGTVVYAAASGKCSATGNVPIGICLEAASADGNIVEISPLRPGVVVPVRTRFTIAQVNAGATLLAANPLMKWRMQDVIAISVGGAAGAVTTVDLLGTQSASGVKLAAFAQANLTQNTVLRPGVTGTAVLAGGASFIANDANTAITIGKTGSDVTTATHIDIIATFVMQA
jgi:hypothetical protein